MSFKIKTENTAIKRWRPSRPAQYVKNYIWYRPKILDWGCGKGDDLEFFKSLNGVKEACGFDPHWSPMLPTAKYNIITCSYVLNVIPTREERIKCIADMIKYLDEDGNVFLSVRDGKEINRMAKKNGWKEYKDGFLTKHNTFQCPISAPTLISYVHEATNGSASPMPTTKKQQGFEMVIF